jgi:hypothetical protein
MRGTRSRSAESTWRGRVARFRRANLSVVEFCRREGVSVPSFYQWRKRLEQEQRPSKRAGRTGNGPPISRQPSRSFVPVTVASAVMGEIEFPNGVRIRVPANNAEALRAAVLAGGDWSREAASC